MDRLAQVLVILVFLLLEKGVLTFWLLLGFHFFLFSCVFAWTEFIDVTRYINYLHLRRVVRCVLIDNGV